MQRWVRGLTVSGTVLGTFVMVYGFARFAMQGAVPPLLVALAVLVAGPGEDILKDWARRRGRTEQERQALALFIDRATSVAFLVCLALVVFWP